MDEQKEITEELLSNTKSQKFSRKKKLMMVSIILVLVLIAGAAFMFYQKNIKLTKELELGQKYLDEEKYEEAVLSYENAIAIDAKKVQAYEGKTEGQIGLKQYSKAENTIKVAQEIEKTDYSKVLTADIYSNTKRKDEAVKLLDEVKTDLEENADVRTTNRVVVVYNQLKDYTNAIEILENTIRKRTDKSELKKLYDELIDIYVKAGKSNEEIEKLLEWAAKATEDDAYIKQKEKLIVAKPTFSEKPGEFEKSFDLEIKKSSVQNTVYYTLDETEPSQNSMKYEVPIPIVKGKITVKAIEINTNGMRSEVLSGTFTIKKNQLTEAEFNEQISGAWYNVEKREHIMVGNQMMLVGPTRSVTSEILGDYTIKELKENGGVVTIDMGNHSTASYDFEFDFGEAGDGKLKMKILAGNGEWLEYLYGESLGNGQYAYPEMRKALGPSNSPAQMPNGMY